MEQKEHLVKLSSIFAYIGNGLRVYEEGEKVLNANHIMFCGKTLFNSKRLEIFALCIQTSNVHGNPHELNLKVNFLTRSVIECRCSCVAGAEGKCKYSLALLLHVSIFILI